MFIACGPLIWLKQDLLRSTEKLPPPPLPHSQISVHFPASRSSIQVRHSTSAYRSAIPAPHPLLVSMSCIMRSCRSPVFQSHLPALYCYPLSLSCIHSCITSKFWSRIKFQRIDLVFEYRMPFQCNIPISDSLSRIPYPSPLLLIAYWSGLLEWKCYAGVIDIT